MMSLFSSHCSKMKMKGKKLSRFQFHFPGLLELPQCQNKKQKNLSNHRTPFLFWRWESSLKPWEVELELAYFLPFIFILDDVSWYSDCSMYFDIDFRNLHTRNSLHRILLFVKKSSECWKEIRQKKFTCRDITRKKWKNISYYPKPVVTYISHCYFTRLNLKKVGSL